MENFLRLKSSKITSLFSNQNNHLRHSLFNGGGVATLWANYSFDAFVEAVTNTTALNVLPLITRPSGKFSIRSLE